jgi:hypothetical protein
VESGSTARYSLQLFPSDLPHVVALTAASPAPSLDLLLEPMVVASDEVVTLVVTDTRTGSDLMPGLWYSIPITGTGGGFVQTTSVDLLIGGDRAFLPVLISD